jgi:hypothetical protein
MTIKQLESELEAFVSRHPKFAGYRPHVQLRAKRGRKIRCDSSADNWSPASFEVVIDFEPAVESASSPASKHDAPGNSSEVADSVADLIRSLHQAEFRPGYDFVALKWFRDSVLPAIRPEWTDAEKRSVALRDAIEHRLILVSKVPNPKAPMFPVTSIRLNRSHSEVQAVLGKAQTTEAAFQPVAIRGEALSATVLRERR